MLKAMNFQSESIFETKGTTNVMKCNRSNFRVYGDTYLIFYSINLNDLAAIFKDDMNFLSL